MVTMIVMELVIVKLVSVDEVFIVDVGWLVSWLAGWLLLVVVGKKGIVVKSAKIAQTKRSREDITEKR